MLCKNCRESLPEGMSVCTKCGANQYSEIDRSNIGLNILSWFIPIFGIVYFFIKRGEKPNAAKGTLKTSLISAGVNFVLGIIICAIAIAGMSNFTDKGFGNGLMDYEQNIEIDNSSDYGAIIPNNVINHNNTIDVDDELETETRPYLDTTNWDDCYTVNIENDEVTLPLSYDELVKKTGCAFKTTEEEELTVEPDDSLSIMVENSEGKLFYVLFTNNTDDTKAIKDCPVTSIATLKYMEEDAADIVFANNLHVGVNTSLEELEGIFGKSCANWYYSQQIRGYGFYEDVSEFGSDRSISVWLNNNGNIEKISAMKIS